jgi:hypothetical protein
MLSLDEEKNEKPLTQTHANGFIVSLPTPF